LGSAHNDEELHDLRLLAEEWIKDYSRQLSFFPEQNPNNILLLNHTSFIGVKYNYYYRQISAILNMIGLNYLPSLLLDLTIIRIFEPASKLRSLELLEVFFGISHNRKSYYRIAPQCIELKETVTEKVLSFAKTNYGFDYDLLFYDVTTLYFETFEEDELRKNGFSKDNKSQQPQILIALMVNKEGFPIAYEIFPGNTFEGHTIVPVIKNFIRNNAVKNFTVVADAAMISTENIRQLTQHNINYIVGARMGNISSSLLEAIDKNLEREDGRNIRLKTENGYLICSYSTIRYRKDFYEMNKQIEKARQVVEKPSRGKKLKFTISQGATMSINEPLIEKTKKLLGIKGYYTNLEESVANNTTIIDRYHELYRIEQAFRMSKSDLQTRPIFHYKEEPIKLHMLICFMALVVSKHIEFKTGISIRKFIDESKKITDGQIINHITNKTVTIKARTSPKMDELMSKIFSPH
jgi:transposase